MTLPRDIQDRVERVFAFHQATKLTPQNVRTGPDSLDWNNRPGAFRLPFRPGSTWLTG
jgi:hypothetical protein